MSRQAVTRVNVEQASKRVMWEPTRLSYGEGRRCVGMNLPLGRTSDEYQQSHRGSDDGMSEEETMGNTGSPDGAQA